MREAQSRAPATALGVHTASGRIMHRNSHCTPPDPFAPVTHIEFVFRCNTLKPRLSQPSSPLIPGVHCVEPRAKYADAVCLAPKPRAQARRGQLTSAATLSAVAVLNYDRSTRAIETADGLPPAEHAPGGGRVSRCVCARLSRDTRRALVDAPPYFIKESRHACQPAPCVPAFIHSVPHLS